MDRIPSYNGVCCGAFLAGAFFLFLRHIVQNCHKLSKNVISGLDFLKNDDIWSNFIKLDQIGSTLVSTPLLDPYWGKHTSLN